MKKLLYITDQDEYVDHSFIAPLFEVYLKKQMIVDIVYFTDFKSDFERKDNHRFVVPSCYKSSLLAELNRNDIDMESYDFVMVRNNLEIMEHILKYRDTYHYKALYRFSFPKRSVQICCEKAENKHKFFSHVLHPFKTKKEAQLINQCDAFLPTSTAMHKTFLPDVTIPTILCSPAIDPAALHDNQQHGGDEKRFIYVGTLDKVRQFETVLEAFSALENKLWVLMISTRDTEFIYKMLEKYPTIEKNIEIYNAKTKDELLDLIAKADIGVALLPNIPIYNSSTPVKIFDYYSSAVPCLMTQTEHSSTIFTDLQDAWFCDFSVVGIKEKLTYLLALSKDEVMQIGIQGQERLLAVKNYETLAKNIATTLETL